MLLYFINSKKISNLDRLATMDGDSYSFFFKSVENQYYTLNTMQSYLIRGGGYFVYSQYNPRLQKKYLNASRISIGVLDALIIYLYDGYNYSDLIMLVFEKKRHHRKLEQLHYAITMQYFMMDIWTFIRGYSNIISEKIIIEENEENNNVEYENYEIIKYLFYKYNLKIKNIFKNDKKVLIMYKKNRFSFYFQSSSIKNSVYDYLLSYSVPKNRYYEKYTQTSDKILKFARIHHNQPQKRKNLVFVTNIIEEEKEIAKCYNALYLVIMCIENKKIKNANMPYIFILYTSQPHTSSYFLLLVDSNLDYNDVYYTLQCFFNSKDILVVYYRGRGIHVGRNKVSYDSNSESDILFFIIPERIEIIKNGVYVEDLIRYSFTEIGYYKISVENNEYGLYITNSLLYEILFDAGKLLENESFVKCYQDKNKMYVFSQYNQQVYSTSMAYLFEYYAYYLIKHIYLMKNDIEFYVHHNNYDFVDKLEKDLYDIERYLGITKEEGIYEINDCFYSLSTDRIVDNIHMIYEKFFNTAILIFFTGQIEAKRTYFCSVVGKLDDIIKIHDNIVNKKIKNISYKAISSFVYHNGDFRGVYDIIFI